MISIAASEAASRFEDLLRRAAGGEEIVITERGRPLARLVGATAPWTNDVAEAVAELRRLRATTTLGPGVSWKDLRDEGRR